MRLYIRFIFILCFIFVAQVAAAQSFRLISYYPNSALLVERGLPFAVVGAEKAFIKSVVIENGNSCRSRLDPYYPKVFHLECKKSSMLTLKVLVSLQGFSDTELTMSGISVSESLSVNDQWNSSSASGF